MHEGRVLGIGGYFIRSGNPARLAAWYRDHLGIAATESGQPAPDGEWVWMQEAGPTVFAAFRADSDYFAADRQVMLNLRVERLDALLARLEEAGVEVSHREAMDGWAHLPACTTATAIRWNCGSRRSSG